MDRLDCLRAFIRVMESGSFSTAAREMGLGQPAISKRISLLERDFEAQLFLRTTRKLTPTPEANRVYDQARQILDLFDATRANVKKSSPNPTGTLRIGVPASFGRHYLMPLIADYMEMFPDVRLDVQFNEGVVDLVEGGIELALRIGDLKSSALVARRLGYVRRYLVASEDYLAGRTPLESPDDLRGHNCIQYSRFSSNGTWSFESEFGRHVVEVKSSLVVDDTDAMLQAVLSGVGVAILPVWCVQTAMAQEKIRILMPNFTIPSLPLQAVYLDTHWMSIRARTFLDHLISQAGIFDQQIEI